MNKIPLLVTILVLIGNAFSGQGNKTVSDFHNLTITPSGRTFSIWGIIYTGLLFVSYKYNKAFDKVQNLYILSGVLNLLWLNVFLKCSKNRETKHNHVAWSSLVLIGITVTLYLIVSKLDSSNVQMTTVFGIYSAWTIVASMLNISIAMKEKELITDCQIENSLLSAISIAPSIVLGLSGNTSVKNNLAYPITWLWASIGIYTNNNK